MLSPDHIAETALLEVSRWQRETPQQIERAARNDNTSDEQYGATLDVVRGEMAYDRS